MISGIKFQSSLVLANYLISSTIFIGLFSANELLTTLYIYKLTLVPSTFNWFIMISSSLLYLLNKTIFIIVIY